MTVRSAALKKIEKVYGLIETMHSIALQQAAALVQEAERALAAEGEHLRAAQSESRQALRVGDREQWAISEVDLAAGEHRQQRLESLRNERVARTEQARREYGASRIQRGQIRTVVETQAAEQRAIEARRAQGVSDDRHLSRLRWRQLQVQTETA